MIGVFDSGLGGLSVLRHLLRLAPGCDYVYLADTARVPYGNRSESDITAIAKSDVEFLLAKGADSIAAGCGTASSVLKKDYLDKLPVPFCGAVMPAAMAAANIGGKIALLATAATVKNGRFERLVKEFNPNAEVVGIPCPDFVPLIEGGIEKNRAALDEAAGRYMLDAKGADAVVLGCTHFPLIADIIERYTAAQIVDIGLETAKRALPADCSGSGTLKIYVSGNPADFAAGASDILGRDVSPFTEGFNWNEYKPTYDND